MDIADAMREAYDLSLALPIGGVHFKFNHWECSVCRNGNGIIIGPGATVDAEWRPETGLEWRKDHKSCQSSEKPAAVTAER